MKAIRLHAPGVDGLRYETIETPPLLAGEVLIEVHAAAITRDELEWPLDRLPAIPSYELSGVVAATDDVAEVSVGDRCTRLPGLTATGLRPSTPPLQLRSWRRNRRRSATWRAPPSHCRRSAPGRGSSSTVVSQPARGCSSTERWAVSDSSRRSSGAGGAPTSSRPRRRMRSRLHMRLERTKLSTAAADSSTISSKRSISSSTRSAASSSCARPRCSRRAVASSRSPRSRRGKGRTS
jgi:hypothetical protein